ncbi:hypothetical protein KQ945_15105 [Bacillus subtilis subsp. subtilis]|nr:hypothetical protein [Bacillus subtilis subsp. subtilis]
MTNASPAASAIPLRHSVVRGVIDVGLLTLCAIGFACLLTARLQTDRFGWAWPSMYAYERSDVLLHALLASLVVMPVVLWVECRVLVRRCPRWQDLVFALATLLVMRLGPPDPRLFGNTWTPWEITYALFLQQWLLALPLTVLAVLLRRLLRAATGTA